MLSKQKKLHRYTSNAGTNKVHVIRTPTNYLEYFSRLIRYYWHE